MVDLYEVGSLEITVDSFGKTWININGACAMRIGHAKVIVIDDPKRGTVIVYEVEKPDA